jgi:ornithine carbamoyltransferase
MPIAAGKLCSDLDLTREELVALLALAHEVKRYPARYTRALAGQYISLMFEKPSLRTRLTFELAIKQLGGDAVVHNGPIDGREPVKDMARNLDRWTQAIVARTFSQSTIDELAKWSTVPVVNALSDLYHPCQALADMQTLEERCGDLRGLTLAFVGDGNNMSHSLMLSAIRLGMNFNLATPEGYTANAGIVAMARDLAEAEGARLFVTNEPELAAAGAHAVYTDVWASMGQESEAEERKGSFAPFQVNDALLSQARPDAVFMHCLPAKRGQEVTDSVMESERSLVFEQAENRLHAQKALLLMLLA